MTLLDLCDAPPVSLTAKLAAYLKQRPNIWLDGRELATVAGFYAFRSRVADARREFGLVIENRQERVKLPSGERFTRSFYRYVP